MNFEYIRKFSNFAYGECYLLEEKEDCFIVYTENNFMHFIVCTYIDEMGTLLGQEFFNTLDEAKEYFNRETKNKIYVLNKNNKRS